MSLIDKIFDAGIIGCGGAGFPAHVKLNAQVEYLIINAAECEPLLRTDRYIMKKKAFELISAIEAVGEQVGAKACVIALKGGYVKEIASLETAILAKASKIKIHKMDSFYPAGDEQVIVYEVTGRVVPPAGIPLDVGCVVSNTATMLGIYDAMNGTPFTHKYLTVTGAVKHPVVVHCPVGTSFQACIEQAGGALLEDYAVISGGPMMGKPFSKEEASRQSVTKTTSGIIVLNPDAKIAVGQQIPIQHMLNRAKSACIQCSYCTQLCPRHLLGHPIEPHKIMRKAAMVQDFSEMLDDETVKNALYCCECGVCEIAACPMQLQPRRVNAVLKKLYAENGIRPQKGTDTYEVSDERAYRKIPTQRVAARAGVFEYNSYTIDSCIEYTPQTVNIALKQNIGAPPELLVKVGDRVKCGDLLAKSPDGKLSANLHASIDGLVTEADSVIRIEGGE